jgi:hypothetical protein
MLDTRYLYFKSTNIRIPQVQVLTPATEISFCIENKEAKQFLLECMTNIQRSYYPSSSTETRFNLSFHIADSLFNFRNCWVKTFSENTNFCEITLIFELATASKTPHIEPQNNTCIEYKIEVKRKRKSELDQYDTLDIDEIILENNCKKPIL